ncbi:MAG: Flp pilus assembly protein CpaB [Bdellovibrionales bacterium]
MSSRKIILLSLALLIGLATFLAFRSTTAPKQQAQAPIKTTEVAAAARDLAIGTVLKETDLKWIPWPANAENGQLYVKGKIELSSLVGSVLREGFRTDEQIVSAKLVQPHQQGFLAAILLPGMRAMTIPLTPSSSVAGFIFPGDHVDVILTHSFSRKDVSSLTERRVSETVLTDVRVLALDQKSDNHNIEPKVAQLATLEVTPKQAEKLALALDIVGNQNNSSRGMISLIIRSLASEEEQRGNAVGSKELTTDSGLSSSSTSQITTTTEQSTTSSAPGVADNAAGDNASSAQALRGKRNPTWDSDVSPVYPAVNGEDTLMQKVQVMRGKEITETVFERRR